MGGRQRAVSRSGKGESDIDYEAPHRIIKSSLVDIFHLQLRVSSLPVLLYADQVMSHNASPAESVCGRS
jgi:hypothetical protein